MGRLQAIIWTAAFVTLGSAATPAGADDSRTPTQAAVFLGVSASHNLGEQTISPAARVTVTHGPLEAAFVFDKSAKLESSGGFLARARIDAGRRVFVGIGFTHRDGGAWSKEVTWARLGWRSGPLEVALRRDLTSPNRVAILQVNPRDPVAVASASRFVVQPTFSLVRYNGGRYGTLVQVWVGLQSGARRKAVLG
jgi:hypothetical protein